MKEIVMAYLTGVINAYDKNIQLFRELKVTDAEILGVVRDEFITMLDFIADIKEENFTDLMLENETLKNDIEDLQEVIREANCDTDNIHDMLFGRR